MRFSKTERDQVIQQILTTLIKMEAQMAASQQDLDNAIKALSDIDTQTLAAVTAEDTGLTALIAAVNALIAKIQAGVTPADLTTEVTAVQSLTSGLTPVVADLQTQTANIQAAITAAKAITG